MNRVLCTGCYGFIGSNLVQELSEDYNLILWDKNLCEGIDIDAKFDYIYHLAAITDSRYPDDIEMYRNNILSFLNVLDFTRKSGAKLIYTSSAATYGSKNEKVINAYAHSKILIDEIVKQFLNKYPEMRIVGMRLFNVYGRGELMKEKSASMITQWREQILKGERPGIFKGDYKRDFIYVKDVVKGLIQAMKLDNGIYDLGTGVATDFRDVLKIVIETLEVKVEPLFIENPYENTYQEFTKADISWGFKPEYSLREGIKDYFENETI